MPQYKKAVLCLIFLLFQTGCTSTVRENLDREEARTQVLLLEEAGIQARAIQSGRTPRSGWAVEVPSSREKQARSILASLKMPVHSSGMHHRKQIGSILFPEPGEEKMLKELHLSSQIEEMLESIPGVLDARIHLNLPQKNKGLFYDQPDSGASASASVLIRHIGETAPLSEEQVNRIIRGAVGKTFTEKPETIMLGTVLKPAGAAGTMHGRSIQEAGFYRTLAVVALAVNIIIGLAMVFIGIHFRRMKKRREKFRE